MSITEQQALEQMAQEAIDSAGAIGQLATVAEVVALYRQHVDFARIVDKRTYTLPEARALMAECAQMVGNETGRANYLMECEEADIEPYERCIQ